MLKLLQFIFLGHVHKWRLRTHQNIYATYNDDSKIGDRYIFECEECGSIKIKEV